MIFWHLSLKSTNYKAAEKDTTLNLDYLHPLSKITTTSSTQIMDSHTKFPQPQELVIFMLKLQEAESVDTIFIPVA